MLKQRVAIGQTPAFVAFMMVTLIACEELRERWFG
jgi:hypothetical protein